MRYAILEFRYVSEPSIIDYAEYEEARRKIDALAAKEKEKRDSFFYRSFSDKLQYTYIPIGG